MYHATVGHTRLHSFAPVKVKIGSTDEFLPKADSKPKTMTSQTTLSLYYGCICLISCDIMNQTGCSKELKHLKYGQWALKFLLIW